VGNHYQVVEVTLASRPLADPVAEEGMLDPEFFGRFRHLLVVVAAAADILLLLGELGPERACLKWSSLLIVKGGKAPLSGGYAVR
jgi:hypothetical protein